MIYEWIYNRGEIVDDAYFCSESCANSHCLPDYGYKGCPVPLNDTDPEIGQELQADGVGCTNCGKPLKQEVKS